MVASAASTSPPCPSEAAVADFLVGYGEEMVNDGVDIKRLLADNDFVLPLNANDGGGGTPMMAFWLGGGFAKVDGDNDDTAFDGDIANASVGFDARFGNGMLAGIARVIQRRRH